MTDRVFFVLMLGALTVIAAVLFFGCGTESAVPRAEIAAVTPAVTFRVYTVWCGPDSIALVNERRECRLATDAPWPTPVVPYMDPRTPPAVAVVCGPAPTRTP